MFNFFFTGLRIILLILPVLIRHEDKPVKQDQIRVVFYNVENLFYPENDSLKEDDDFTPEGMYHWTYRRYLMKIRKLAQVIISMSGSKQPALIGLCEVENRRVLEDLIFKTLLHSSGYRLIHQESPDPRGIDVALIYDPGIFIPEKYQSIRILQEDGKVFPTRSILKVTGRLFSKFRCHLFINHWPSRRGGQKASEPRRFQAAKCLKNEVDHIFSEEVDPNIIIMGDFNDEPVDKSLQSILKASEYKEDGKNQGNLFNVMFEAYRSGKGTHYRKNHFIESSVLDQFILSCALMENRNGMKLVNKDGGIYRKAFLINEKNGMPLRCYQGLKYLGGISDHLPVFIDITFEDVEK